MHKQLAFNLKVYQMIITSNATNSRAIHHVRAKRPVTASLFRPSRTAAATLSSEVSQSQVPASAGRWRLVAAAATARCAELQPDVDAQVGEAARCAVVSVGDEYWPIASRTSLSSIGRCCLTSEMLTLFGKRVCFSGVDDFEEDDYTYEYEVLHIKKTHLDNRAEGQSTVNQSTQESELR